MAEEKAELLQGELEAARERIQELEMDLEILKSEMHEPSEKSLNFIVNCKLKRTCRDPR